MAQAEIGSVAGRAPPAATSCAATACPPGSGTGSTLVTLVIMLMSGLMIFNAHPRLYWGQYGANYDPAWLEIGSADGRGFLRLGDVSVATTGVLGVSQRRRAGAAPRLPGLGDDPLELRPRAGAALAPGLRLGVCRRHRRLPARRASSTAISAATCCRRGDELRPRHIWQDIKRPRPAALPHGRGGAALQHPAEARLPAACCCVLIPLMVLTGLTMSPGMDATWPWLLDLFGGRQSARSIHFIAAGLIVVFIVVHLADGDPRRPVQRDPLDDHRPLPPAEGEAVMARLVTRRGLLRTAGLAAPALLLGGCDWLGASPSFRDIVLGSGEWLSYRVQRLIGSRRAGARVRSRPRCRRSSAPTATPGRARRRGGAMRETGFADWRLRVDGLVERPRDFSLAELRAMPARTQITRHDCVEGWSAIGKWTGVPLGAGARAGRLRPEARYIVFHCADDFRGTPYYESIDLVDAFHPQTILAWGMNDADLPSATARRCGSGSSGSSATSTPSSSCASRRWRASPRHRARQGRLLGGRAGYDWYAGI